MKETILQFGEGNFLRAFVGDFIDALNRQGLYDGRIVIVKSRGGEVLIGALTKLSKRLKDFYITYSFSVQQIQWEDMVKYDAND